MTNAWMVIAIASAAAGLARELLRLVRHVLWRASIERVATQIALPGGRLVEQDEHGARFELTIAGQQLRPPRASADTERNGTE